MKAIVILCILLASLLFSSPSIIVARELADQDRGIPPVSKNPNKPAIPCNPQYSSNCIRNPKPPVHKCNSRGVYRRNCQPPHGP